jgi:uncharacterized membrane protein
MDDREDDEPSMNDLVDELEELAETVDDPDEREQVEETLRVAIEVESSRPGVFGRVVRGFDRGDLAEALLGSVLFGIPMAVEDGALDAGAFVADRPLYLAGTVAFTIAAVYGVIYVADIQDVRVHRPILGVVPRRLVGVLGVATVTAVALLTAWGRVDWSEPWLATCQVAVAVVPMAIGAALGDILPGS